MRRREKTVVGSGKVAFEVLEGRRGGTGIFGLEEKADERTPEFGRGDGCVRPKR